MGHESRTVTSDLRVDQSLVQPSPLTQPVSTTSHRTRTDSARLPATRPLSPVVVDPIMGCRGERVAARVGWLVVFFVVVCPAAPVLVGDRFPLPMRRRTARNDSQFVAGSI